MAAIEAVDSATGPPSIAVADDPLSLDAVREAWRRAGGHRAPVGVLEVHDSYSIMGVLILEALGLAERGRAAEMVASGEFTEGGGGPLVNPSGGLKARGHPVGATGVYMAAEIAMQLAGVFPGLSAHDARAGAAVSVNGHGSSAYVALMARR
jgi:acetyl-CoA C-acetyltransferase/acetyl-CoA acyltransferase